MALVPIGVPAGEDPAEDLDACAPEPADGEVIGSCPDPDLVGEHEVDPSTEEDEGTAGGDAASDDKGSPQLDGDHGATGSRSGDGRGSSNPVDVQPGESASFGGIDADAWSAVGDDVGVQEDVDAEDGVDDEVDLEDVVDDEADESGDAGDAEETPVSDDPAAEIGEPGETATREKDPAVRLGPEPIEDAPAAIEAVDGIDDVDHSGLRAERYDGVYAQGVPIWVAMTATRFLESRDDYTAEARGSTASGAYQVIDSTWNGYGGYARAKDAPPAVQDQFAYESMVSILKRHGNDVSAIPVAWYFPAALRDPLLMDIVPVPSAGNVLTPRQYQARWMMLFHQHLENGSPVFLPADSDPLIPAIAFPVLGPTSFWDDWHAPRDGGARRHEGLDFMGEVGQPLRAAFDGVVTRVRPYDVGRPGVGITITREDGLRANYFHLDGELRWHPDLEVGSRVNAGQVIAYMGATGNAGVPHLHFELRTEEGEPIAPYPAVLEAVQREQCSVGIGPWSTAFESPAQIVQRLLAELVADDDEAMAERDEAGVDEIEIREIVGPDGARWTISTDGAVTAVGAGALIAPGQGACTSIPTDEFGTGAAGLSLDLLPEEWWGEEVDPDDLEAMIAAVEAERSLEFGMLISERSASLLRMRIGDHGLLASITRPAPEAAPALFAHIR